MLAHTSFDIAILSCPVLSWRGCHGVIISIGRGILSRVFLGWEITIA